MKQKNIFLKTLAGKVLVLALICSAAFLSYAKFRQWEEHRDLQKQLALLREEEKNVRTQNADLEKSLDLLSSDAAGERIARMQLNLKKEGEQAVVFLDPGEAKPAVAGVSTTKSNLRLWWEYFFLNSPK
jgi:cell division protein FtsB